MSDLLKQIEDLTALNAMIIETAQNHAAENVRMRAALEACSARFISLPCTVGESVSLITAEFQRRMDIAGAAITMGADNPEVGLAQCLDPAPIVNKDLFDLERRLASAEWILANSGFVRCDLMACNCGSWHQTGGFKARFDEIKEVVEAAGYLTNGRTLLAAVKAMVWNR